MFVTPATAQRIEHAEAAVTRTATGWARIGAMPSASSSHRDGTWRTVARDLIVQQIWRGERAYPFAAP